MKYSHNTAYQVARNVELRGASPKIETEMDANQEHSSKTGSGNFNTHILQKTTENFKNHDKNEEQDRYMDRGNQFYGSISSHELPLAATNGPILRKTTINIAPRTTEEKHVSIISRLMDTEKTL